MDTPKTTAPTTGRQGNGRFAQGNQVAARHVGAGGRPTSEVRAMLREDGLAALPRIREIAATPEHKEYLKANLWLAERGLKDDLEGRGTPKPNEGVQLPGWEKAGGVQ